MSYQRFELAPLLEFGLQVKSADQPRTAQLSNIVSTDAAVIYFALQAYKISLLKTVEEAARIRNETGKDTVVEDEVFCYEQAAICARIQYAMVYDHDEAHRNRIKDWMGL